MHPVIFHIHRPAPPLDRFVEQLWYWEGPPPAHAKDRMMPNGSGGLVINLAEDEIRDYTGERDDELQRFPGAVLMGAYSRYSVIDTREQAAVLGVNFRPGGMWPFFDPAAEEVQNQHVALSDVWRSSGATLRERLLVLPTPAARLRLLEEELLANALRPLTRRPEIDFAVNHLSYPLVHGAPEFSIAALSETVGLSTRRLTRLFSLEVGLTPKLYARVKRFEQVRRLMLNDKPIDWSELALTCGYFDQSHLIRDCRLMSGFTPTELRARGVGDSQHVAI